MIPHLRQAFNEQFTEERYRKFLSRLTERSGCRIAFRNCETPCFFPHALLESLADTGRDLLAQLSQPEYHAASEATLPDRYRTPHEDDHPLFVQADFGLIRNEEGAIEPRLVEIQGFPSLYAYQAALAEEYIAAFEIDGVDYLLEDDSPEQYRRRVAGAIVGAHDPENVILLEIHPEQQKTRPDFTLTEQMTGVETVCATAIEREGRRLFYRRQADGKRIPVYRIYNRVIVDEVERKGVELPFSFNEDLDVEWAGHPNWYFRISKFSIPYLRHACVPETRFLDQIERLPDDLDRYVLKPLYSFAGLGVKVGVSRADIAAIPAADRHNWILQERVAFTPVIETPHGATQAEIRVMYIWDERPMTGAVLIRMGRGKMMGVDHNKDLEWVGASAGLFPK